MINCLPQAAQAGLCPTGQLMSSAKFKAAWLRRDQHLKPVSRPGGTGGTGDVAELALSWGEAHRDCLGGGLITLCLITMKQFSSAGGAWVCRCEVYRCAGVQVCRHTDVQV